MVGNFVSILYICSQHLVCKCVCMWREREREILVIARVCETKIVVCFCPAASYPAEALSIAVSLAPLMLIDTHPPLSLKFYAIAPCNHRICHVCSLRIRANLCDPQCEICKIERNCSFCRAPSDTVRWEGTVNDVNMMERV